MAQRFRMSCVLVALLVAACSTDADVPASAPREGRDPVFDQLTGLEGESVALLSLKYGLDTGVVRSLLDDYERHHNLVYSAVHEAHDPTKQGNDSAELRDVLTKIRPTSADVMNTITRLARSHRVEPSVVASLVWDYRALEKIVEAAREHR